MTTADERLVSLTHLASIVNDSSDLPLKEAMRDVMLWAVSDALDALADDLDVLQAKAREADPLQGVPCDHDHCCSDCWKAADDGPSVECYEFGPAR